MEDETPVVSLEQESTPALDEVERNLQIPLVPIEEPETKEDLIAMVRAWGPVVRADKTPEEDRVVTATAFDKRIEPLKKKLIARISGVRADEVPAVVVEVFNAKVLFKLLYEVVQQSLDGILFETADKATDINDFVVAKLVELYPTIQKFATFIGDQTRTYILLFMRIKGVLDKAGFFLAKTSFNLFMLVINFIISLLIKVVYLVFRVLAIPLGRVIGYPVKGFVVSAMASAAAALSPLLLLSSEDYKENIYGVMGPRAIKPVNPRQGMKGMTAEEILSRLEGLNVPTWNYKWDPPEKVHLGPIAEEWHRTFPFGMRDTKSIPMMDETGVLMVSLQALADRNRALEARVRRLEKQNKI